MALRNRAAARSTVDSNSYKLKFTESDEDVLSMTYKMAKSWDADWKMTAAAKTSSLAQRSKHGGQQTGKPGYLVLRVLTGNQRNLWNVWNVLPD